MLPSGKICCENNISKIIITKYEINNINPVEKLYKKYSKENLY